MAGSGGGDVSHDWYWWEDAVGACLQCAFGSKVVVITKVNTGMKTIERAQQKVESGKVSLASALDTLNANASMTALQVSASSTELANAASSLESAQSKLDEAKDTAYDSADLNKVLSKDTITSLLAAQNFDMPAGYAMDGDTQYLIRVGDAVQDVDELKDLPLMDMGIDGIDTIRLSDVAEVKVTDNSDETYAVINGNPGIMLSMEKQTGYSTGEVTNRILDKFKVLEKEDSKLHLNVFDIFQEQQQYQNSKDCPPDHILHYRVYNHVNVYALIHQYIQVELGIFFF